MIPRVRQTAATLTVTVLTSVALGASGCGAGIQQLRDDTNKSLADMRSVQAQHAASIEGLKEDVRRLTGQLEESRHIAIGKTQELEQKLSAFGSRVPPPEGIPTDILELDENLIAPLTGAAADQFRAALQETRAGDLGRALADFKAFSEQNPGTAFSDNALLWSGIISSKLGQNDQAIVYLSDVFQKYPAEDRVAPALYYLGDVFSKAGQNAEAEATFQKLVDEQPRSPYAQKARERISGSGSKAPAGKRVKAGSR